MPSCSAYGCTNRVSKKIPGVTFHRFPKDEILRAEWIKAVRRADWTPTVCSRLCSEHFEETDFNRTPFRTFLNLNAVPSIFKGFPKWMQKKTSACCSPVSVSSSPITKQEPSEGTLAPHIKDVGSTNEIVVNQNKPEATPTFVNYGKNDCNKNTIVIVSDAPDYKNVLNDHSDANRRIVISDQLIRKNRSGSSLASTYQSSAGGTVPESNDKIGVDMYKEDPLLLFDGEFHIQRIKELEEVIKAFYKQKKNWFQKIRRMKRKLKKLRKEYIRCNKKNHSLLSCNSQPVVHFLALDVPNV